MSTAEESIRNAEETNFTERPRGVIRREKIELTAEIAATARFTTEVGNIIELGLLNARVQVHKDMSRHRLADRFDLERDVKKVNRLLKRRQEGEAIGIAACLDFLNPTMADEPRRQMIPRIFTLTTGFLRKCLEGGPKMPAMLKKIDRVEAFAQQIRGERSSSELRRMTSLDAVTQKLRELLPTA